MAIFATLSKALRWITRLSTTYTIERHEDPARFIGSEKDPRAMTIKELREQIAYKREAGQISRKEQVKLYHKTAYPFAAVVVVMLGAPIAIRFGRAGFFAGLVIAFSSLSSIGHSLSRRLKAE